MKWLLQFGIVFQVVCSFAQGPPATRTGYDLTLKNGFSIHHLRREVVGTNTRLFIDDSNFIDVPTSEIDSITESPEAVPMVPELANEKVDLKKVVAAASDKHRIDPDLITSVIHAESSFNPKALSPKGAQGLMQLMPGTATRLGVTDAFDPYANVDAGTHYLRELLLQYNGDMAKALAAYNAGPLRVQQYHGVPPFRQTRAYVAQVINEFNSKKLAARASNGSAGAKTTETSSNSKTMSSNQNR